MSRLDICCLPWWKQPWSSYKVLKSGRTHPHLYIVLDFGATFKRLSPAHLHPSSWVLAADLDWWSVSIEEVIWDMSDRMRYTPITHSIKMRTGEANDIDYLVTLQCSSGKPWVRVQFWVLSLMVVGHPIGQSVLPHCKNSNGQKNVTKCSRHWPGFQIPKIRIRFSSCGCARTSFGGWCTSSGIHINTRPQVFPEHCAVTRWSMLFTLPVSPLLLWLIIALQYCSIFLIHLWPNQHRDTTPITSLIQWRCPFLKMYLVCHFLAEQLQHDLRMFKIVFTLMFCN